VHIFGLREAIGVEQEAVALGEWNFANGIVAIEGSAEVQAVAFDAGELAAGSAPSE
jgi:hypothetical protein